MAKPAAAVTLVYYCHFLLFLCSLIRPTLTFSSMDQSSLYFRPTVSLTTAAVEKALAAGEREAEKNGWKVTIAITDTSGPLIVKRCNSAFPASYDIAVEKANTAVKFQKKTGDLENAVNVADGKSRTALLSAPFVLMRGGVPIFINGMCVGAVGVSGVAPDQDEQVALAAIDALNQILASKL